jgi:flagellar biosynthesis protein FlhA
MPPSGDKDSHPPIQGVLTRDPTFGLPAFWVREELRAEAESKGYTVIDAAAVLATHLAEVIRDHAHEIVTRDDTKERVEQLKKTSPALVEEVTPQPLGLGDVHRVLKNLLREGVSVRNLAPVFEALADHAGRSKDPDLLAELARERLARTLSAAHVDATGALKVVTLDPALEQRLADLASDPNALGTTLRQVADRVKERVVEAYGKGFTPVVAVRPTLRRVLALQLLELKPRVAVLSYNEIAGVKRIDPVGAVKSATEPTMAAAAR